jgi:predicted nucleic acid-binding Zn ribbon protein
MQNNFVIDHAKTLYKPNRPKDIDVIIKEYTTELLPHFFKYAKDKNELQITRWKPTAINYLENIIPTTRITFNKNINKINYKILLHDSNYEYKDAYQEIIDLYDYLNSHKYKFYKTITDKTDINIKKNDSYLYQQIRKKLLSLPYSKETIVDTLVYFLYTQRKDSVKKTLWECFGKEIYENIKEHSKRLGNICPICGHRINDVDGVGKKYCSQNCENIAIKEYKRSFYKRVQDTFLDS